MDKLVSLRKHYTMRILSRFSLKGVHHYEGKTNVIVYRDRVHVCVSSKCRG
jgi:hypothetical protein